MPLRHLLLCLLPILGLWGCGESSGPAAGRETEGTTTAGIDDLLAQQKQDPYRYADVGPTRLRFTDVSATSGMDVVNHSGRAGVKEFLLEAVGPGSAWFDYDNDGYLDLYIPDGDVFSNYALRHEVDPETRRLRPLLVPKSPRPELFHDQLWRNNGDGTFTNMAQLAGVADVNWSFGVTAFDYDADGWTDLYVSNFGPNALYRNNGDGTFTDVAERLGVAGKPWTWSTCAAVGDMDGDGRLDLYVGAYADPAAEVDRQRVSQGFAEGTPVETIGGRQCRWRSIRAYCGPIGLVGQHDTMYRQREDGTFEDVSAAWGMVPPVGRYAFTCLMFDFNDDGMLDVYVANDSEENFMWQQGRDAQGRIQFRDTSNSLGVKFGSNLVAQASMGAVAGDFDYDGRMDIFVTNFSHDYNNIFMGQRVPGDEKRYFFKDRGLPLMAQVVFHDLSWGAGWYDFDNDRDLDLYVANGHVYKEIDLFRLTGSTYEQYNTLMECVEPGQAMGYREVGKKAQDKAATGVDPAHLEAGSGTAVFKCSRQAGFGDYDNDGRLDIVVLNMNETPTLLRNESDVTGRHWLKLTLRQPGRNREALGATLEVSVADRTFRMPVMRLTSFLGTDDARLHVGLGEATTARVRVTWPGVERETSDFGDLAADTWWELDRASGKAAARPLRAFSPRQE